MYELNGYFFIKSGRGCFRVDHVLSFLTCDAFVNYYIDRHGFVMSSDIAVRTAYLEDIWEQADRHQNGIRFSTNQIDTGAELPVVLEGVEVEKPKAKKVNRKSEAKKE